MKPGPVKKVVAFGEFLLRLKSPGFERLFQTPQLEAIFGGTEANVAVALAAFGIPAGYVTVLPENNPLSEAALSELRRAGVETDRIVRGPGRFGIYYLESGANQRPSRVFYDREGSSMALAKPGRIAWDRALENAGWFHITGITPAISASAADLSLEAVQKARALGLKVSIDVNYRSGLWKWGKKAIDVMREITRSAHVLISNQEHARIALGLEADTLEALTRKILGEYPNLESTAVTLRESVNASQNTIGLCFDDRNEFLDSRRHEITHIVDRIGAGDALTAGLIYGLLALPTRREAVEFAAAAGCLKHSIPGDFSRSSVDEVNALLADGGSGRVQR